MYIETVPNHGSKPTILLRDGKRVGGKVVKTTRANITKWPPAVIRAIRDSLAGKQGRGREVVVRRSLPHGHVEAVLAMMRKLGLPELIGSKPCRERSLVLAMVAERLLHPASKLGAVRLWNDTTLASELEVEDAEVDDLYAAMDWLSDRQGRIEKKLAARHLSEGCTVLYDTTNSRYTDGHRELAEFGNDKEGNGGFRIISYGVLTDIQGRPVAARVYPGNTGDPTTVADQVETLRRKFGLRRVVFTGDRGTLTQTRVEKLRAHPGLGWLSALRSAGIRKLVEEGSLDPTLFDELNLAEIASPEYPGERLIVCKNPFMAEKRRRTRDELLLETEDALAKIVASAARRTQKPLTAAELGRKVGAVENKYKMRKHFDVVIENGRLAFSRNSAGIAAEAALDGFYVIRTSEPPERLTAEDAVRGYKSLAEVERPARTLKGVDILARPIHHRDADRVRTHIFICVLAYYVEWHLREALKELLFDDGERRERNAVRDPVAKAEPSKSAQEKRAARETAEGLPLHGFDTLLDLNSPAR